MFPTIEIQGFPISVYGLMTILGFGIAALYLFLAARGSTALPAMDVQHVFLLGIAGAVVGGKILYILTILPFLVQNWALLSGDITQLLGLLLGGYVFYGGLFGMLGAAAWYCRRYGIPLGQTAARITPAIPLFHVFGRVGCFLSGCCFGIPVSWGLAFTHSPAAPNGIALFPVQLVEAGGNFLLFLLLLLLVRKLKKDWLALPVYLLSYAVMRFGLEFFRGDKLRGVWLLSTSQWISLVLVPVVSILLIREWKKTSVEPT